MITERRFSKSQLVKAARRGFDLRALEARRQRLEMEAYLLGVEIAAICRAR
jgi:hypothetical protein